MTFENILRKRKEESSPSVQIRISKGKPNPSYLRTWLIQHLKFQAEASARFETLVKQTSVCFFWQRARYTLYIEHLLHTHVRTLTKPYTNVDNSMLQKNITMNLIITRLPLPLSPHCLPAQDCQRNS